MPRRSFSFCFWEKTKKNLSGGKFKKFSIYTIIPWVFQILSMGRCPTGPMLLIRQTATGFLHATQYTVSGTVHNRTHNLHLFSLCLKQSHDKVVRFVSFTVTTLLSSSLSLSLSQSLPIAKGSHNARSH